MSWLFNSLALRLAPVVPIGWALWMMGEKSMMGFSRTMAGGILSMTSLVTYLSKGESVPAAICRPTRV